MIRTDPIVVSVVLLFTIGSCSPESGEYAEFQVPADWDSAVALASRSDAPDLLERYRQVHGVPVVLWVQPDVPTELTSQLDIHEDHPCGPVATVFRSRMPVGDSIIAGEPVVEFDEDANVRNRWIIPVDVIPGAVRGNELLVRLRPWGPNVWIAVSPDGDFRVVPPSTTEPIVEISCPPLEVFRGSVYVRCRVYPDLEEGDVRRIAYQGPCT